MSDAAQRLSWTLASCPALLQDDVVHQDLAHELPATSQLGVGRFYSELISSLADTMLFAIDEITEGDPCRSGDGGGESRQVSA